jgi:hypothetical protein
MDSVEARRSKRGKSSPGGLRGRNGKPDGGEVRSVSVQRTPKKRGRTGKAKRKARGGARSDKPAPRNPTVYAYGFIADEWQDGGIRGRILVCGKPGSGKSYLIAERVSSCRRVVLFNTANVQSFDRLKGFTRISTPAELKQMMRAAYPDGPLRVVYTPIEGDKLEHFELVCRILKVCGHCVFAVDEIDTFMSANYVGGPAFYELTNYGRHLKIAMIGSTRNTVAVSRQYTSMLTEICIFAMTEPRYLKYFEETCGSAVSDEVPLLGKHEYLRWMADGGTCERRKGWSK